MSNKVSEVEKGVSGLRDDVNSLRETTGYIFETTARTLIERRYGQRYAQPFLIESLFGLARLAMPKKNHLLPKAKPELDEAQLLNSYAESLRSWIFKEKLYCLSVKNLFKYVSSINGKIVDDLHCSAEVLAGNIQLNTNNPGSPGNIAAFKEVLEKLHATLEREISSAPVKKKALKTAQIACSKITQFLSLPPQERSSFLEGNSRAGLYFFCSVIAQEPILSLEIDCRGLCELFPLPNSNDPSAPNDMKASTFRRQARIEVGEIKSILAGNEAKAKVQLVRRLTAIAAAHAVISAQYDILLTGKLFYPASTKSNCTEPATTVPIELAIPFPVKLTANIIKEPL